MEPSEKVAPRANAPLAQRQPYRSRIIHALARPGLCVSNWMKIKTGTAAGHGHPVVMDEDATSPFLPSGVRNRFGTGVGGERQVLLLQQLPSFDLPKRWAARRQGFCSTVEAALSLRLAWRARSPALLTFGGDTFIELLTAMGMVSARTYPDDPARMREFIRLLKQKAPARELAIAA